MATVRSARQVVELYNLEVWNNRNFALAEELFADQVIRHEVGDAKTLTRADAVQRVVDTWQTFEKLHFDLNVVVAGDDGEHVCIVYDSAMTNKDGSQLPIASIEVFRVVDGRIVEVYNCGYGQGVWK